MVALTKAGLGCRTHKVTVKTVTEIYTFSNNTSLASESQKFQGPVSMVAVSVATNSLPSFKYTSRFYQDNIVMMD